MADLKQKPVVAMPGFNRQALEVNGVETIVYTIGQGPPLVFLHGAGSFTGFEAMRKWADMRTVIVPYHPGFGESADDPTLDSINDYVLHYLELFDLLDLSSLDLMGFSLGGWMAAEIAAVQPQRINTLILIAPAGLVVPAHPAPDLFAIAPGDLPAYLAHDSTVALRYFPQGTDPAFEALIGREMSATGRLIASMPQGNPKLARWLHRLAMPALLLWGENDRIRPVQQGKVWQDLLPRAQFISLPATGHLLFEERPTATDKVREFLVRHQTVHNPA